MKGVGDREEGKKGGGLGKISLLIPFSLLPCFSPSHSPPIFVPGYSTSKYIGPNLANSIPPCLTSPVSFFSGAFVNSLYQQPTTEQEIFIEICTSFRTGTAACYDQITMNVIKEMIDLIVQPLT